ncbi:hypothetical protein B0T17DRAFT_164702 [Bombardia bombarda]|uniref:Uncharacterized protein n=1 Tax=Bombardia bombarda TaxID=252184 RepID=A0AA39X7P6_9PEZI|nr:hypothetical protein B0T17DRAFT_164702 [Bombardia bombarda]
MFRINVFRYQYKVLRGTNPCEFLESPTNFNDPSPDKPDRIIVREHGGDSDNHVQWVSTSDIEPYKIFRGTSEAHGKIIKSNGFNNREDKVWLRSDQPLTRGRKSAPIVNLTQLQNAEVW